MGIFTIILIILGILIALYLIAMGVRYFILKNSQEGGNSLDLVNIITLGCCKKET